MSGNMDNRFRCSRGYEDDILDVLIKDGVIKVDEKERFRGLVNPAYCSTLPAPSPEEVVHIVADYVSERRRQQSAQSQKH